jgi:hypothetical protein
VLVFIPGFRVCHKDVDRKERPVLIYACLGMWEKNEGHWREFTPEMPEFLKRDDEGSMPVIVEWTRQIDVLSTNYVLISMPQRHRLF